MQSVHDFSFNPSVIDISSLSVIINPFFFPLIMQGARNEIFAMQPAPVQISYMGFPGTTGASYIHYLVTDEVDNFIHILVF